MNSERADIDLDELLKEKLTAKEYETYQRIHEYHFWEWKTHRICNESSLRGLRWFLYRSGAATLASARNVEIRRPFHDYAAKIGIPLDRPPNADEFSGVLDPRNPQTQSFSNPGDCRDLYENARPGWVMRGYGETLSYSVELTLRNCLKEELRRDRHGNVNTYLSPAFYSALKVVEIWSVGAFAHTMRGDDLGIGLKNFNAPFEKICQELHANCRIQSQKTLVAAKSRAEELLAASRSASKDYGHELVFGTMLGFLIDELLAKSAVPNGMGFWYRFTKAVLTALMDKVDKLRHHFSEAGGSAEKLAAEVTQLIEDCDRYGAAGVERQPLGAAWADRAQATADELRRLGFDLRERRKLEPEDANIVFSSANAIWRWLFFLEQRESFTTTPPTFAEESRSHIERQIYRWLRRPWGIVTIEDVNRVFRGLAPGDENDEVPRAFSALTPMLRTEAEQYLGEAFAIRERETARDLLYQLIHHRNTLHLARLVTHSVSVDAPAGNGEWKKSETLIELLVSQIYDKGTDLRERVSRDVSELVRLIKSGDWLRELIDRDQSVSRRLDVEQRNAVAEYLKNPVGVAARLFRFDEEGFRIEEEIGVYPPETYSFSLSGE